MRVTVRNALSDVVAFGLHLRRRNRRFRAAPPHALGRGAVDELTARLHPPIQRMRITDRTQETPTTATFRMTTAAGETPVAIFRAGQYVTVEADVGPVRVSRPFSIASPPDESQAGNCYDITVRTKDDGLMAPWIMANWQPGTLVQLSDPQGYFYYDELRDAKTVVGLAGGSGVTPFRSMVPDLLRRFPDVEITLLYGIASPEELIFRDAWARLEAEHSSQFRFIPVCSGDVRQNWKGETGLLNAELVRKYVSLPADATYFVCGPGAMHEHLNGQLESLDLKPRRIRKENYGADKRSDTQSGKVAEHVRITVEIEGEPEVVTIPADPAEPVLVALERAGINPPALCRSGECGWCRGQLVDGNVHMPEDSDHRRAADRKFGYFHLCSAWPESDLTIRIPRNPK